MILGGVAFSTLALLNAFGSTASGLDVAVAKSLHRIAIEDPGVTHGFLAVTPLGDVPALTALTVLASGGLFVSGKRLFAGGFALSMLGVGIANFALKLAFRRERPSFLDPVATAEGWSFPSGHAMGTIVAVGLLTYIAFHWVEHPPRRLLLLICVAAWVLIMSLSRMVLGVHYLSDVVAGLAAGTTWLALSIKAIERAKA